MMETEGDTSLITKSRAFPPVGSCPGKGAGAVASESLSLCLYAFQLEIEGYGRALWPSLDRHIGCLIQKSRLLLTSQTPRLHVLSGSSTVRSFGFSDLRAHPQSFETGVPLCVCEALS